MTETLLTNRTFDELKVGDSATLKRSVDLESIKLFARASGDFNPAHVDAKFAEKDFFGHIIAHGMWTAAVVSAVLGTKLPGPGTIYLGQELRFEKPVFPGDTITAIVTVTEKRPDKRIVVFDTRCTNQKGEEVLCGRATVIAPFERMEWPQVTLPEVVAQHHDRFDDIVAEARALPLIKTALVHPCSPEAIQAAIEIRDENLLDPVLIGPEAKIRAAAEKAGISLDGFEIISVEHSHAAAEKAVELAVAGKVSTLMKGSLHTDELLGAVVAPGSGLRTARRISHAYVMDVPAYEKLLVVTDAAINIAPTLDHKRDICQNAIDLLQLLGNTKPKVAVLAAVETINDKMQATLDAAALTVMAARGQITGASVDGPLAFDNAISLEAARTKGIVSPVAGQADILLVPDLEAGNMLAKQLLYFAGADAAGLVLGARVPIILTSRSDSLKVRIASAALAKLVAAKRAAQGLPAQ
ncbi:MULTISPECIES: bifunctional enoyl-CoA hydratase/phosphate acetyltransferase [Alphaproteobacteria]|uniref:Bifunctional enoyl-CoA hydratase/phosphate acetyltransferase n=2 Tax=Alphaproteobacteria TaxID=28211 RepID=A0A512HJ51_9HYPH|nr:MULTISPECIES: bifunctional enoyl-CoA hydratase/phosphate acetyltransferase [Alphaproteobacteria]GEO85486.1 bifunctional enoyl-CoA hydratase/phosphate acetyltransferase [Ciceribacter naphthalenivorans]GLR21492.1 bifunctional enoyl-CoA hydratase/phosphate acetyltransferase [Ciceribacter naphthalenivorans]GLT04348.1 bifunctional enoyl-CoA hydratase/phosphate acetyltransferase [Sphingomonas psychrolutea]